MKVTMCQVNPTVGDLDNNCNIILGGLTRAIQAGDVHVVLFPEMVTTGYPPRDLLYRQELWDNQRVIAEKVQKHLRRHINQGVPITAIYGGIEEASLSNGHYARYNVAYIVDCDSIRIVRKRLLPCYDVFDETRYFTPSTDPYTPVRIKVGNGHVNCDILICEDIWNSDFRGVSWQAPASYIDDPTQHLYGTGPLFVLNASPYWHGKMAVSESQIRDVVARTKRSVFWVNQVGAHDDIVTGGYSMVAIPCFESSIMAVKFKRMRAFAEDELTVNPINSITDWPFTIVPGSSRHPETFDDPIFGTIDSIDFETWCTYKALILHIQDYCRRCGFKDVVFGCSGGVDSALVAALACDALGSENVTGITMPSKFSSEGSVSDSQRLADNYGFTLLEIPIGGIHTAYRNVLLDGAKQEFYHPVTDENLQPRARCNILFAYSNDYGPLVLTTGNKSEITIGYCTIYGDMAGGLGVIGDLWKTEVFAMCRFINKYRGELIPVSIINKPPSAELKENQQDTDSLPPYEVLDPILKALVEDERPVWEVQEANPGVDVGKLDRIYKFTEYKRRQMPDTCKVSERAYGSGRRQPIAAKFTLVKG